MKVNELLKLSPIKRHIFKKEDVYDFEILNEILENCCATVEMNKNFDFFKEILNKVYKVSYKNGGYNCTSVEMIFYKSTPIIIYEIYKSYSYWNINYLDDLVFEFISLIKSKLLYIEYKDRRVEADKLEWLDKYIIDDYLESTIKLK